MSLGVKWVVKKRKEVDHYLADQAAAAAAILRQL
jgi:hypothetical protein